ncbi:MAG TPA: hypothetical protein VFA04_07735 [Bryobacteraceae bacterium]|nr:hypothetical protein [Bryobacteraceae bacterium]
MDRTRIAVLIFSLLSGAAVIAQQREAAVPPLINFAGALKDAAGKPLAGPQALTFALYSDPESRTPLWQETQNVQADEQGRYSVHLGAATASGMPLDLFTSGQSLWLGVQPQATGAPEQSRVLLVSAPYALKAADAETLGGKPASAFVTRDVTNAAGGEKLAAATNTAAAGLGTTSVLGGSGTAGYIPMWTDSADIGNSVMFQSGTKVGVGTTVPSYDFDLYKSQNQDTVFEVRNPNTGSAARANLRMLSDQALFSIIAGSVANGGGLFFQGQGDKLMAFQQIANAPMSFYTNNAERMRVLANGNVGIGTTAPAAKLEVNGTAKFDGLITFAPGQTFPGGSSGGTVFSVGSGTGLTGGPITGSGTLSIDTSVVPQLGASNTFTTGQTIDGALDLETADAIHINGFPALQIPLGHSDVFVGTETDESQTGTVSNSALGHAALSHLTGTSPTANANTAVGNQALENVTDGGFNTGVGNQALSTLSTGGENAAVGAYAGNTIVAGNYNTFLGASADATGDFTNATAIGYNAKVGANDSFVLGGSYTDSNNTVHHTYVGIGTSTPSYPLTVQGTGTGTQNLVGFNDSTGTTIFDVSLNASSNGTMLSFDETNVTTGRISILPGGHVGIDGAPDTSHALTVNGDVLVNGALQVTGVKNFRIDDPLDPVHKQLFHASIESSEMKNLYDGTVRLNAHGQATVELPKWFEALNGDFRYQLTAIGRQAPGLYVRETVHDGHFVIAGGKPGMQVSWQVTGIRHDEWARQHPMSVEVEKAPAQ